MSKKGFRATKAMTKGQLQADHGTRIEQNTQHLSAVTHAVMQTGQHLKQLQDEVGLIATLLRYVRSNEPSTSEDFALIDCLGRLYDDDGELGEAFEGGTLITHAVDLSIEDAYVEGFVKSLVGKSSGEVFNVDVIFPKEYHSKNLAGKKANFEISVIQVFKKPSNNNHILDLKNKLSE